VIRIERQILSVVSWACLFKDIYQNLFVNCWDTVQNVSLRPVCWWWRILKIITVRKKNPAALQKLIDLLQTRGHSFWKIPSKSVHNCLEYVADTDRHTETGKKPSPRWRRLKSGNCFAAVRDHVTPALQQLHWLPIEYRIFLQTVSYYALRAY